MKQLCVIIEIHLCLMTKQSYLLKIKATVYKYFRENAYWYHRLKVLRDRLNNFIESSKKKYYNRIASKL